MTSSDLLRFLRQRMQQGNISSTTLVFTFFCDVVTQHGGDIWLGSISHALAPLSINDRLTRTAVFRLVKDGWLESRKQGRRSYYRLSPTGQNYYLRAAGRIYASDQLEWDENWSLLFTSPVPEEKRDALNRGLLWLGFGRLAPGVYALPCNDQQALDSLLADMGLQDHVVKMLARADQVEMMKTLVLSAWKLDKLRKRYSSFISRYLEARKLLTNSNPQDKQSLLLLRVLLIHEYRRILLSDPALPAELLPADWESEMARSLTGEIYRSLASDTAQWVNRELMNADGYMDDGLIELETRFPVNSPTRSNRPGKVNG